GNCSRGAMPHALLFQAYSLSAFCFKRQAGLVNSRLQALENKALGIAQCIVIKISGRLKVCNLIKQ
ncbi:MAG: hypothetical protein MI922_06570, partial [Bacteroidales bacterium]|nr:hypothetical protein [Bacteroidales bacterium]